MAQLDPDIQRAPQLELLQGYLPSTCWAQATAISGVALQNLICIRMSYQGRLMPRVQKSEDREELVGKQAELTSTTNSIRTISHCYSSSSSY